MRKVISLLLVAILLIGVASAEIDLGNMTLDEIREIYTQVSSALYSEALIKGAKIPVGRYTAGVDIPAGSYILTFEWDEFDQYSNSMHKIYVYDAKGDMDIYRNVKISYPNTQGKVTLADGETLVIETDVKRYQVTPTIQLLISYILNQ